MERNVRKKKTGKVVKNKADKTVVIAVLRKVRHPIYGKYYNTTSRLMAHDPDNACQLNDEVLLMETRPLSKKKRWRVAKILSKST